MDRDSIIYFLVASIIGLLATLAALNHLSFFARMPHIERMRREAPFIPAVRPEVDRINQHLRQMREWNRSPWLDVFASDLWDDVPPIRTDADSVLATEGQ